MKRNSVLLFLLILFSVFAIVACSNADSLKPDSQGNSDTSVVDGGSSSSQSGSSSDQGGDSVDDVNEPFAEKPEKYTGTIEVEDGKDFVILNLTDFQLHDGKSTYTSFSIIDELVSIYKPDLITVLGDTAEDDGTYGTKVSFKAIIDHIDALNIPWAPVYGNHDNDNYRENHSIKDVTSDWINSVFLSAKNCLFKIGPDDVNGNGNYVVNIVNKKTRNIVKSLLFFDTGTLGVDSTHVKFYDDALGYCKSLNGNVTPESICFMHIPLPEYRIVYDSGNYSGIANERPSVGSGTTDFFAKIKELGSTTHVICGHDHVNSFHGEYQGVNLMYCLKSSDGDYYNADQLGGTVFTIGAETTFEYRYIEPLYEVLNKTSFKLEHIEGWKYSGAKLLFDIKPTDGKNSSNKVSFSLLGSNIRRTSVSERDRNGEWNRLSNMITIDFSNMTANVGTLTAKGDGWYSYSLDLHDVPLNTSSKEESFGDETLKLLYFTDIGRSFGFADLKLEKDKVTETDQADLSGATIETIPDQQYSGSPVFPELIVKYGAETLAFGEDYFVEYTNNNAGGTANVKVVPSGIGSHKWKGLKSATFTIIMPEYVIRGDEFTSGEGLTKDFTAGNYSVITFEYKIISGQSFGLAFLDRDWEKGYGYFYFNENGAKEKYAGVSTEVLDDTYIKVTIVTSEVTVLFNEKPETVSVFYMRNKYANAGGYVDKLSFS